MTFDDASANRDQKFIAPPENRFYKIMEFRKKVSKNKFGVEKRKIANRPKRFLPKFHADPSVFWGVNGRSKFRKKIEICELTVEKITGRGDWRQ